MSVTKTFEFQLATDIDPNEQEQLHRSVTLHLLTEKKMKMVDALARLSPDDQQWLVNAILKMAQENLYVACHIADEKWVAMYWHRYGEALGHLFAWYHQSRDVSCHGQLLSILRTITRRYSPKQLTAEQLEYIQRLTMRLHDKHVSQEAISEITHKLEGEGIHTLMDLSPIADQLFTSYVAELGRD